MSDSAKKKHELLLCPKCEYLQSTDIFFFRCGHWVCEHLIYRDKTQHPWVIECAPCHDRASTGTDEEVRRLMSELRAVLDHTRSERGRIGVSPMELTLLLDICDRALASSNPPDRAPCHNLDCPIGCPESHCHPVYSGDDEAQDG